MWSHSDRLDLSSWLIHFVHKHKPEGSYQSWVKKQLNEDEAKEIDIESIKAPDFFDENGCPKTIFDEWIDDDWKLSPNASAFDILRRIIHDGFVKSGWSFRGDSPTIYGPYSTVCFTEMPLYALIDYANKRGRYSGYVAQYGIAFKRKELFAAGARSVIYGLSGNKYEAKGSDKYYNAGFRALSERCGIGREEQYRYVHTDLNREPPIDWTFEREWRLAIKDSRWGDIPGLPFFLSKTDYHTPISEVVIIVATNEEKSIVLDQLANMYNSKSTNLGYNYQIELIRAAKVVAVEQLKGLQDYETIRLDSINPQVETEMSLPRVNEDTVNRASEALNATLEICENALKEFQTIHPEIIPYSYPISHAKVCTDGNTEITQALFKIGKASTFSEGIYYLDTPFSFTGNEKVGQFIMQKAADFLTEQLGQKFYVFFIPD